jgi:hypothetical protein
MCYINLDETSTRQPRYKTPRASTTTQVRAGQAKGPATRTTNATNADNPISPNPVVYVINNPNTK